MTVIFQIEKIMERTTKRRRTIAVESWERTTITTTKTAKLVWCERLSADCSVFATTHFAEMIGVDLSEVLRLIESGKIHAIKTSGQIQIICSCSFRAF
jgi:hypothetical protein